MGDMIFLVAGYGVIWIIAFAFIFSMVSRQRNIQKDLEILEQMAQHDPERQ
jgi:CcmD family protein